MFFHPRFANPAEMAFPMFAVAFTLLLTAMAAAHVAIAFEGPAAAFVTGVTGMFAG